MRKKILAIFMLSLLSITMIGNLLSNDGTEVNTDISVRTDTIVKILKPFVEPKTSLHIVDMPAAGLLEKMTYSIGGKLINNGGFVLDFTTSLFSFASFGISYGGDGVIGNEKMNMQRRPGFQIKGKLLSEDNTRPSIAIGFNSQGRGRYLHDKDRFEQLSAGFYLVCSKNTDWILGNAAAHVGINYSVEDVDNRGINIYAGAEQGVFDIAKIVLEINPNLNDKNSEIWKNGKSFMINMAVKFFPSDNIVIEFQLKDMIRNSNYSDKVGRFFGLYFISKF